MLISKDTILSHLRDGTWKARYRGEPITPSALTIGPNSVDVTLHHRIYEMGLLGDHTAVEPANTKSYGPVRELDCTKPITLQPGRLYLGAVNESFIAPEVVINNRVTPVVPQYEGRSTCARIGLQSHLSAGFGDHGFYGAFTTEITVIYPTVVHEGMRIGQVYFMALTHISREHVYKGAYAENHNDGPVLPVLGKGRF